MANPAIQKTGLPPRADPILIVAQSGFGPEAEKYKKLVRAFVNQQITGNNIATIDCARLLHVHGR
jgi:hypothetical protein